MAIWVLTMPFGAFYFVQQLASVQIPVNREHAKALPKFIDELTKIRAALRDHIQMLRKLDRDIEASLYSIVLATPKTSKEGPLYTQLITPCII